MNNSNGNIYFLHSSILLDSQPNYALSNESSYVIPFQIHQLRRPPGYKASLRVNLRRIAFLFLRIVYVETYTSLYTVHSPTNALFIKLGKV